MSGLDVLGAVASAFQIADLGTRLLRANVNVPSERRVIQEASASIVQVLDLPSSETVSSKRMNDARTKLREVAEKISVMKYEGRGLELRRWLRNDNPREQIAKFALALGMFNSEMSILIGTSLQEYQNSTMHSLQGLHTKLDEHASQLVESAAEIKRTILGEKATPTWQDEIIENVVWDGYNPNTYLGRIGEIQVSGIPTQFTENDLRQNTNPDIVRMYRTIEILKTLKNLGGVLGYYGLCLTDNRVVRVIELAWFGLWRLDWDERPPFDVLGTALSIARTISYIHACGIIHKGISPYAIVLDENYKNPKITEFGFSRFLDSESCY
jgi:hypothetical protein